MRSSTVLSAALLASGAVAAPIAYGTVNDQDISIRDNFAEASRNGITDEPNTLDRRQKIPIVHNPIPPKLPGPQPAQPHKIPVEEGDKTPKVKPEDLERRQTNTILQNAIQAAKVGKNHVQHQVQEEMNLPAQGNYHPPKFPGKAPVPVPQNPVRHKNPFEGWHARRDAQPEDDMSEGTLE